MVRLKEPVCPGGPLNLRGFELRGAGPSADGSALGGSMYWASGLHLYTPLPFRPGRDGYGDLFKTHVFVTAGNVGNFGLTGDLQRDLDQVLNPTFTSSFSYRYVHPLPPTSCIYATFPMLITLNNIFVPRPSLRYVRFNIALIVIAH